MRRLPPLLLLAAGLSAVPYAAADDHGITLAGTGCAHDVVDDSGVVSAGPIAAVLDERVLDDASVTCFLQAGTDAFGEGELITSFASGSAYAGMAVLRATAAPADEVFVCTLVTSSAGEQAFDANPDADGTQCAATSRLEQRPRFWYAETFDYSDTGVKSSTAWQLRDGTVSTRGLLVGWRDYPPVWGKWCIAPIDPPIRCPRPGPVGGGDPPCPVGPLTSEALAAAYEAVTSATGGAGLCPAMVYDGSSGAAVTRGTVVFDLDVADGNGFEIGTVDGHELSFGVIWEHKDF